MNSSSQLFSSNTLANPTTPFYGGGGNASGWANFPAVTNVNMNGNDINNLNKINNAIEVSALLLTSLTTNTITLTSGPTLPLSVSTNGTTGTANQVLTAVGNGDCIWANSTGGVLLLFLVHQMKLG